MSIKSRKTAKNIDMFALKRHLKPLLSSFLKPFYDEIQQLNVAHLSYPIKGSNEKKLAVVSFTSSQVSVFHRFNLYEWQDYEFTIDMKRRFNQDIIKCNLVKKTRFINGSDNITSKKISSMDIFAYSCILQLVAEYMHEIEGHAQVTGVSAHEWVVSMMEHAFKRDKSHDLSL